jgi:hypothetical protein
LDFEQEGMRKIMGRKTIAKLTSLIPDSDGHGVITIDGVEANGNATAGIGSKNWVHTAGSNTWLDQHNGLSYTKSVVDHETQLLVHMGNSNAVVKGCRAEKASWKEAA